MTSKGNPPNNSAPGQPAVKPGTRHPLNFGRSHPLQVPNRVAPATTSPQRPNNNALAVPAFTPVRTASPSRSTNHPLGPARPASPQRLNAAALSPARPTSHPLALARANPSRTASPLRVPSDQKANGAPSPLLRPLQTSFTKILERDLKLESQLPVLLETSGEKLLKLTEFSAFLATASGEKEKKGDKIEALNWIDDAVGPVVLKRRQGSHRKQAVTGAKLARGPPDEDKLFNVQETAKDDAASDSDEEADTHGDQQSKTIKNIAKTKHREEKEGKERDDERRERWNSNRFVSGEPLQGEAAPPLFDNTVDPNIFRAVEQVPWERDIHWGEEPARYKKKRPRAFVEEEDDDASGSANRSKPQAEAISRSPGLYDEAGPLYGYAPFPRPKDSTASEATGNAHHDEFIPFQIRSSTGLGFSAEDADAMLDVDELDDFFSEPKRKPAKKIHVRSFSMVSPASLHAQRLGIRARRNRLSRRPLKKHKSGAPVFAFSEEDSGSLPDTTDLPSSLLPSVVTTRPQRAFRPAGSAADAKEGQKTEASAAQKSRRGLWGVFAGHDKPFWWQRRRENVAPDVETTEGNTTGGTAHALALGLLDFSTSSTSSQSSKGFSTTLIPELLASSETLVKESKVQPTSSTAPKQAKKPLKPKIAPLFPNVNQDFMSMEWLHSVIWDDEDLKEGGSDSSNIRYLSTGGVTRIDPTILAIGKTSAHPKHPPLTSLILDRNDLNMVFEEKDSRAEKRRELEMKREQERLRREQDIAAKRAEEDDDDELQRAGYGKKFGEETTEEAASSKAKDPFNVSNDHHYKKSKVVILDRIITKHSRQAVRLDKRFYRQQLSRLELAHLHRPKVALSLMSYKRSAKSDVSVKSDTISFKSEREKLEFAITAATAMEAQFWGPKPSKGFAPKKPAELSAVDGDVILVEYLEQNPILMQNFGMATKLINYIWGQSRAQEHDAEKDAENQTRGETVRLGPKDKSPFLSTMPVGSQVLAWHNNMFIAPIAQHQVKTTDFMLIRPSGSTEWCVREIPAVFTIGQLEPKAEVPAPNSREAGTMLKHRLEMFIYRLFNEETSLEMKTITDAFGDHVEQTARKILSGVAQYGHGADSGNHKWILRDEQPIPDENEISFFITPEDICRYESMQVGEYRLEDSGIRLMRNMQDLTKISEIIVDMKEHKLRHYSESIERALQLTPWSLTKGFLQFREGNQVIQLNGRGNPFGNGDGFSFIGINQLRRSRNKRDEQEAKTGVVIETGPVTGTDSDLRKLTMEEMKALLIRLGAEEEYIDTLKRWDRVDHIRELVTKAIFRGEHKDLERYARQEKLNHAKKVEELTGEIRSIFLKELEMLHNTNPPTFNDDPVEPNLWLTEEKDEKSEKEVGSQAPRRAGIGEENYQESEDAEYAAFLEEQKQRNKSPQLGAGGASMPSPSFGGAPSPFVHGNAAEGAAPRPKKKIKTLVVRKTVRKWTVDGLEQTEMEIIKEKGRIRDLTRIHNLTRDGGPVDYVTSSREDRGGKEGKRKNAKGKRDGKKTPAQLKKEQDRLLAKANANPHIKCSNCQKFGHSKKSKACPRYYEVYGQEESYEDAKSADLVAESNTGKLVLKMSNIKKKREVDGSVRKFDQVRSRKRGGLGDNEYSGPKRQKTGRRQNRDPSITLASMFEDIVTLLEEMPESTMFKFPVKEKDARDYYLLVKNPMSLQQIKQRAQKRQYLSRQEFQRDLQLLYDNCVFYNGPNSPLTWSAKKLIDETAKLCSAGELDWYDTEKAVEKSKALETLNQACERILSFVRSDNESYPFREPVTGVAGYRDKISEPMDLGTMSGRTAKLHYHSIEQFWDDLKLIVTNCETFNGSNTQLSNMARRIYQVAEDFYQRTYQSLPVVEQSPEKPTQKAKKPRAPPKKKAKTPARETSHTPSRASMQTPSRSASLQSPLMSLPFMSPPMPNVPTTPQMPRLETFTPSDLASGGDGGDQEVVEIGEFNIGDVRTDPTVDHFLQHHQ